jgi:hypothetical protein
MHRLRVGGISLLASMVDFGGPTPFVSEVYIVLFTRSDFTCHRLRVTSKNEWVSYVLLYNMQMQRRLLRVQK